jgi:hypothetical protein
MKNPLIVGLLSIVPGLGLLSLGKPIAGIIAFLSVALFIFLGVMLRIENLSITSFTLALIAWGTQMYYAVLVAQQLKRNAESQSPAVRAVSMAPLSPGASRGEKQLYNARQEVMQLLVPGEYVSVVVQGVIGAPSGISSLLNIIATLAGGVPVGDFKEGQPVYLAISGHDFIHTKTNIMGKPKDLQRVPLSQARLVKFSEGMLTDTVVIDFGEFKPMRVRVGRQMRQGTEQLARSLQFSPLTTQALTPSYGAEKQPQKALDPFPASDIGKLTPAQKSTKSPEVMRHNRLSAIFMCIGYAAAYATLVSGIFNISIMEDPFVREVVSLFFLHLICGLPMLLPAALVLGAIALTAKRRLKLSDRGARIFNACTSFIFGAIAFIPCQFFWLMGAAL